MTSEQECPLCGKEMYYDSDDELYDCQTQSCFLMGKELFDYELKDLSSQISRIKEEAFEEGQKSVERHRLMEKHGAHACTLQNCERERWIHDLKLRVKQEVFDDMSNFAIHKEEIKKIKKRHGVE